jgi:iron complex transport system substrate-binding protein
MRHAWPLLFLLASCASGPSSPSSTEWQDLPNSHATCFRIQQRGAQQRVLIFGPAGRADTLAIVEVPNRAPQRTAVLSTTHVPFVLALGGADVLVGAAYSPQVPDPRFRERLAQGEVAELIRGDQLDRERFLALAPDLIFDQVPGLTASAPSAAPVTRVPVTEFLEPHPLGRAEWVRLFGAMMGRLRTADSLFQAVRDRYEQQRARVPDGRRPRVYFGSVWGGTFHAAPGNSYMARLIRDAGGTYFLPDTAGGNPMYSLESFITLASSVDHIGMVLAQPTMPTPSDLAGGDPRLLGLDALRMHGFYSNSQHSDVFGQALLEPDILLADLIHIFHPGAMSAHRPRYFHSIGQSPIP